MRCPKCGYNSFDHLDSCKKCGKDLVEFKQSYGIKSVLFPGGMGASSSVDDVEFESIADAAVTAAVTGEAVADAVTDPVAATAKADDSDDFGFDFMGDSGDDDDLSFDELFEEAPEDEDIEETIEGPKAANDAEVKGESEGDDLEDDFGFDPEVEAAEKKSEESGTGEGPERPFDLPESSQYVGAPVATSNIEPEPSSVEATDHIAETSAPTLDSIKTEEADDNSEYYVFEESSAADEVAQPTEVVPVVAAPQAEELVAESAELFETAQVEESVAADSTPMEEEVCTPSRSVADFVPPSLAGSVGAFICDIAVIAIVAIGFVVVAEMAMSPHQGLFLPSIETLVDLSIPYFLVIFFLSFSYFTLFHFLVGQTPGKMLTRLRVETVDGEPLLFAQAFLRSVGGLLQLLPAGIGYLLILTAPDRRGWNDRLAGTRVVALRNSP